MKGTLLLLCLIISIFFVTSLTAGGIDNRSNFSSDYVRTMNRNAAIDSLDAIVYNPAGVMAMDNGYHSNVSIQYVLKNYSNTVDGIVLSQNKVSLVPALFGLIKHDRWAGFMAFTIPAGGGEVDYKNGNATTRIGAAGLVNMLNSAAGVPVYGPVAGERLEGESFYYALTLGGAHMLNDVVSFSLAGRYIDAVKRVKASFQILPADPGLVAGVTVRTALLDYEDRANGIGLVFGMSINYESFNIGLKYETETDLDFKYHVKEDSVTGLPYGLGTAMGISNGRKHSRNLPALFALGVGYRITPRLKMDVNFTTYFQKKADWGGAERHIDNGWETGIVFEYMFKPELKWSIGYLYTKTGMDIRHALKEAPELDARSLGTGLVYNCNEKMRINFGLGLANYKGGTYTDTSSGSSLVIGLDKDVVMFSAGLEYHF